MSDIARIQYELELAKQIQQDQKNELTAAGGNLGEFIDVEIEKSQQLGLTQDEQSNLKATFLEMYRALYAKQDLLIQKLEKEVQQVDPTDPELIRITSEYDAETEKHTALECHMEELFTNFLNRTLGTV